MKNKYLILLFAGLLAITGFAVSFDNGSRADEVAVVNEVTPEGEFQSVGTTYYHYTYPVDTITDAENDTIYLPAAMRPVNSDFLVVYSIKRTNISGTTALAVKIEESSYKYSNSTTPPTAGWVASLNNLGAAADTDATTATEEEIRIPNAFGTSYRCIVDGSGTQSSSYILRVVMKKKS